MKVAVGILGLIFLLFGPLVGCSGCNGQVAVDGGSSLDSGSEACVSDETCAPGWVCQAGVCSEPFFCRSDLDCPAASTCNLLTGACVSRSDGGRPDGGGNDGGSVDAGGSDAGVAVCSPLDIRCSADQLSMEQCAADGSAWNITPCVDPAPLCFSGACVACNPGTIQCNAQVAETCRADGSGFDSVDCAASGQACVGGACQLCTPGAVACADATTQSTCNSTGTAWVDAACTNGICDGTIGQCVTQVCTPGVQSCQGDQLMVCDAAGNGLTLVEDCALTGQACQIDTCISLCDQAVAQNSYIGCEYWPVVLPNTVDSRFHADFAVVVSNPTAAAALVTVNDVAGVQVASVSVAPGALETINLPWNALPATGPGTMPSDSIARTSKGAIAYRLQSTVPVTAYQFNPLSSVYAGPCLDGTAPFDNPCYSYSNDASLLLPVHVFGDAAAAPASTYLAMTTPHASLHVDLVCRDSFFGGDTIVDAADFDQPAFVAIVATAPGVTSVTVNPRGAIAVGDAVPLQINAGALTTFTLNQYEVLQLASAPSGAVTTINGERGPVGSCGFLQDYYLIDKHKEWAASDLTGSIITSDQPVAVYGGAECRFMPYGEWACDHMEQQLFPFENWGMEYVGVHSMPTGTADPGDIWRVVAAADGTVLTFSPAIACPTCAGGQATLNAGDKLEFQTNLDFLVSSPDAAHPFMLVQFFIGQNATGSTVGDPTMILSVPTAQYRSDYAFTTPLTIAQDYMNIVRPVGAAVTIDGVQVSPVGGWVAIPGTSWERGRATVTDGVHRVNATQPVGLTVYGYDEFVSYGYPGGLDLKQIVVITPGG